MAVVVGGPGSWWWWCCLPGHGWHQCPARPLCGPFCCPVIGDALLLQYVLQECSIRSVKELTVRQAREMLAGWAAEQDAVGSRRDEVVRAAIDAGLRRARSTG